jgi:2-polyprenyl-6-methoxyphenol hydroxylase-like FAD-dependent oxidoreductase
LGAAHSLSQIDDGSWQVDVYERSKNGGTADGGTGFRNRGGSLGIVDVAAWEALRNDGVPMMRRGRRANRAQGAYFYGDLWRYLWEGLPDNASVRYGKCVQGIGNVYNPVIDGIPYDLVVLADGGFSTLRKHVLTPVVDDEAEDSRREGKDEQNMNHEPHYAGSVLWRGSVATDALTKRLQSEIREGIYKNGTYDTIVLKMAKDNGEDFWIIGTHVATPESDLPSSWSESKQSGRGRHEDPSSDDATKVPEWFLPLFSRNFGNMPWLVELAQRMIECGEMTPHPQFHFGSNQVSRGRVVMIGDAAHMASPRTAVGAHTAIIDALVLREAFDTAYASAGNTENGRHEDDEDDPIDLAIKLYNKSGVDRARQLYRRSVQVSQEFVPRGGMKAIVSPSALIELPVGNNKS